MRKILRGGVVLLALVGLYFLGTIASRFLPRQEQSVPATVQEGRLTSGEAWASMLGDLRVVGEEIRDSNLSISPREQAEGYRHLLRLISVYVDTFIDGNDPLRPRLLRYPNTPTRIGHDNPDNVYQAALIRGDQRYVVKGNIGSVHFVSFNVYSGFIGFTRYKDLRTVSSLNIFDLETDSDGSFEIVLSAEPEPGNWLKLEADAAVFVVRQLFYDWEGEREARVSIRNTAELPTAPPLDPAQMAQRLDDLGRFVSSVRRFFGTAHQLTFGVRIGENELPAPRRAPMKMADPNNQTTLGHFKLEEGHGLLVQFPRGDCFYTNIQLGNMWWESLDYANHQSHLNGFMTHVDSDGRIRYLVSLVDPGVPNWLDTEGRREGTMFLRWTHCRGPAPEEIETRVISLDDVRKYFPADTPSISANARRDALRRRKEAVVRRYAGGG